MDIKGMALKAWIALQATNERDNERRREQAQQEEMEKNAIYFAGREEGYDEAERQGVSKTIQALYEANVSDDEIIRVLNRVYNIPEMEVRPLLMQEKVDSTVRAMYRYLSFQGYSWADKRHFVDQTKATKKIREIPKLWELRREPKKLIELVQDDKKLKQFLNGTSKKKQ